MVLPSWRSIRAFSLLLLWSKCSYISLQREHAHEDTTLLPQRWDQPSAAMLSCVASGWHPAAWSPRSCHPRHPTLPGRTGRCSTNALYSTKVKNGSERIPIYIPDRPPTRGWLAMALLAKTPDVSSCNTTKIREPLQQKHMVKLITKTDKWNKI